MSAPATTISANSRIRGGRFAKDCPERNLIFSVGSDCSRCSHGAAGRLPDLKAGASLEPAKAGGYNIDQVTLWLGMTFDQDHVCPGRAVAHLAGFAVLFAVEPFPGALR